MSVSKWAYVPAQCDGDFCCGYCDECPKSDDNLAIMEETPSVKSLKLGREIEGFLKTLFKEAET